MALVLCLLKRYLLCQIADRKAAHPMSTGVHPHSSDYASLNSRWEKSRGVKRPSVLVEETLGETRIGTHAEGESSKKGGAN